MQRLVSAWCPRASNREDLLMTIRGVFRHARGDRHLQTGACVVLMGTIVASAWAIVPPNQMPAAATTKPLAGIHAIVAATAAPAAASPAGPTAPTTPAGTPVAAVSSPSPAEPQAPQAPAMPPPAWADGLPPAGVAWSPYIDAAAVKEGLDPRLFASLVWAESNFDPAATSEKGALGLSQVMPTTAADLGVDPLNPLQNLAGGARYLKQNLDRFGRTDLALAAYNAGPRTVAETGGVPAIYETVEYVGKVLNLFHTLEQ
jgi:hypothetical protein